MALLTTAEILHAPRRGETLLREFLNVLVALDDYEDNASPDLLLNPYTRELMELDRYYPTAGVTVEGDQPEAALLGRRGPSAMGRTQPTHGERDYQETDLATFEETVKQVGRDAMKVFLCRARGIELAIIQPEDLKLKSIDRKIPGPRRNLEGMEPLVAALDEMAAEHRERTAEERVRKGRAGPYLPFAHHRAGDIARCLYAWVYRVCRFLLRSGSAPWFRVPIGIKRGKLASELHV